jgi:small-conductance mechanosensitive channel
MSAFHFQHRWFFVVFLFCGALVLANLLHYVLFRLLKRDEAAGKQLGWGLQKHLGRPARAVFLLTCMEVALPFVPQVPENIIADIKQGVAMAIVLSLGWFAIGLVYVLQTYLLRKYDIKAEDNRRARSIHTQFQLFRRLMIAFLVVLTAGALLWTSNDQRLLHYGSGLLASAGIASLILATAAKSTASNFLAGLQIALTEPIRIDDVVVVQGEWGRVEEITSAYVVIKIWDQRRLIVPLSWFIENSFANWTRDSSDIMGTAFLYVDYTIPVEELRAELERVVKASPLWDGNVLGLQVTNLTEKSMELRCLMSSSNSSRNFDLRCLVREAMMSFVREKYPEALPNLRYRAVGDDARENAETVPPVTR